MGISHSRNFGSQIGFRSGMEIATKNACVLLDGDLQDPPELIEEFVAKWREGYDVVYGRRVKREAAVVHGAGVQGILPRLQPVLLRDDPAGRGRLLADRPPGRAVHADLPGA